LSAMEPIRNFESVSQGDVLHHPALGFAVVEAIDGAAGGLRGGRAGGALSQGDAPPHPALGFAVVEAIDGASVALRWEKPGENHPERATAGALKKGYRLCPPGGFLAQSVLDPDDPPR